MTQLDPLACCLQCTYKKRYILLILILFGYFIPNEIYAFTVSYCFSILNTCLIEILFWGFQILAQVNIYIYIYIYILDNSIVGGVEFEFWMSLLEKALGSVFWVLTNSFSANLSNMLEVRFLSWIEKKF